MHRCILFPFHTLRSISGGHGEPALLIGRCSACLLSHISWGGLCGWRALAEAQTAYRLRKVQKMADSRIVLMQPSMLLWYAVPVAHPIFLIRTYRAGESA